MPRYYFNVHDGITTLDHEGSELPDISAAKKAAALLAGQLLSDQDDDFWDGENWRVEVVDEQGLIFCTVHFFGTTSAVLKSGLPWSQS